LAEPVCDALTALAIDLAAVRRLLLDHAGGCPPEVIDLGRDLLMALSLLRPALASATPAADLMALRTSMTEVRQRSERLAGKASGHLGDLLSANIAACDYVLALTLNWRLEKPTRI